MDGCAKGKIERHARLGFEKMNCPIKWAACRITAAQPRLCLERETGGWFYLSREISIDGKQVND